MNKKFVHPELIAPAGNLKKMKTAFAFGADAVYAGIPDFSLRVRINDFTVAKLKQAIEYAHKMDKKVYVTINIFAHNRHIEKLPAYIRKLKTLKPDALIASDPGVIRTIKKIWPQADIHLSTQANCTNWQAAKFWHELGVKRVILGREVTIDEIKEIHKKVPRLELECFVHGAMCMAYSGRCFLSKYLSGRSANLGDCVQPCRWAWNTRKKRIGTKNNELYITADGRDEVFELVEEEHGSYILNSQDLCLIKRLGELAEAGVSGFKIEGRAKSVYYLANVVGAYAKAMQICLDGKHNSVYANTIGAKGRQVTLKSKSFLKPDVGYPTSGFGGELDFLFGELESKLVHRGYTEGFVFGNGKMAQNLENSHNQCGWEFCGIVERCDANLANPPAGGCQFANNTNVMGKFIIKVKVHNSLKVGDEIEIVRPFYDIIKMKVDKMIDAETGEEIKEEHGGQNRLVMIDSGENIPEFSVIRRRV